MTIFQVYSPKCISYNFIIYNIYLAIIVYTFSLLFPVTISNYYCRINEFFFFHDSVIRIVLLALLVFRTTQQFQLSVIRNSSQSPPTLNYRESNVYNKFLSEIWRVPGGAH